MHGRPPSKRPSPPAGHVPPPAPYTGVLCKLLPERLARYPALTGGGRPAGVVRPRLFPRARRRVCRRECARVVVGWIIETGIRIGLVSARYMSFFSMEVAIPSLADFPLQTAACLLARCMNWFSHTRAEHDDLGGTLD